jgi:hypothetical protein
MRFKKETGGCANAIPYASADSALMASKIADQQASINKLQSDIAALNQQNTQLSSDASSKVNSLQQNLQAQQNVYRTCKICLISNANKQRN